MSGAKCGAIIYTQLRFGAKFERVSILCQNDQDVNIQEFIK
jgi:hypothetical protein